MSVRRSIGIEWMRECGYGTTRPRNAVSTKIDDDDADEARQTQTRQRSGLSRDSVNMEILKHMRSARSLSPWLGD